MRKTLETQANQIESVLADHHVSGRVFGGVVFPQYTQFQLSTAMGTPPDTIAALAGEIARSVGAHEAHVYQSRGAIQIEIMPKAVQVVDLKRLCRRLSPAQIPPLTAVLGVDQIRRPVLLRLPSPDVRHVLIAGGPGVGKTALARTLLTSLAAYNRQSVVQFVLIDPHERGLAALQTVPHLMCPLISDPTLAAEVLEKLVLEMQRRAVHRRMAPHIIVAIDELADLLYLGGTAVEIALARLAQGGPAAGIHLLVCTRQPNAAWMGAQLHSQFPVRLVGAVKDAGEARSATGLVGSEADKLNRPGDFLLVNCKQTIRLQAAYLAAEGVAETLLDLKGQHAVWHRAPVTKREGEPPTKVLDFTIHRQRRQPRRQPQ